MAWTALTTAKPWCPACQRGWTSVKTSYGKPKCPQCDGPVEGITDATRTKARDRAREGAPRE